VRATGLVAVYLLGAVPVGWIVAWLVGGMDIRRQGSGNIGTTNVLRTLGRGPAILTLLGDVAKGYLAVRLAGALGPEAWWTAAGAVLAVAGNCWSVFLRFGGGKGVATGFGAFLGAAPLATAPVALVWVAVVAGLRYASLGSLVACASLPLAAFLLGYPGSVTAAAAVCGAIIVFRHRENLHRLLTGTERRIGDRVSAT